MRMILKRDKVISSTNKGDRVGVYFEGERGEELLLEMPPRKADKLIKLWNEYTLETYEGIIVK